MQTSRQVWLTVGVGLLLLGGVGLASPVDRLNMGSESTPPEEVANSRGNNPEPTISAQHRLIVQPADSIPRAKQAADVWFEPSPPPVVEAMLKLANVQTGDVVFDLGSGDGRICIAAAKKYKARAYGYEINADLVQESLENVRKNKVQDLVTIERRNIFKVDLSGADVVTLWLLPVLNVKLIPQLEKMKPGSRIVSCDFDMCDVVKPDKVIEVEVKREDWFGSRKYTIYLWKTPLKKDNKLFRELNRKLELDRIGK
jgi:hypothetical protein